MKITYRKPIITIVEHNYFDTRSAKNMIEQEGKIVIEIIDKHNSKTMIFLTLRVNENYFKRLDIDLSTTNKFPSMIVEKKEEYVGYTQTDVYFKLSKKANTKKQVIEYTKDVLKLLGCSKETIDNLEVIIEVSKNTIDWLENAEN